MALRVATMRAGTGSVLQSEPTMQVPEAAAPAAAVVVAGQEIRHNGMEAKLTDYCQFATKSPG